MEQQQQQQQPSLTQLDIDSEHRLRSENLCFDIDCWYPALETITFQTRFLPLTIKEAHAIKAFHDVSWRHSKPELSDEEIVLLKNLEKDINALLSTFPRQCAFMRLCGRSPKDGEPLDREAIVKRYEKELNKITASSPELRSSSAPSGNTKMIAISRTTTLKITSEKEAMSLLLTSERVYSDILDWTRFGEPEQICLREWNEDLTLENEFRVFVYNNQITAISQYDHYTYYPGLEEHKDHIKEGIKHLWAQFHPRIALCNYIIDIGYFPERSLLEQQFVVIELSPFLPCTGAALFSWTADIITLQHGKGGAAVAVNHGGTTTTTTSSSSVIDFRLMTEADLHPQLDDLVELNWDMRWAKDVEPYYSWFERKQYKEESFTWSKLYSVVYSLFHNMYSSLTSTTASPFTSGSESEEMTSNLLFVYGTLKSGFHWNSKHLSHRMGGSFIGAAVTMQPMSLVLGDCGVPYVLSDECDALAAPGSAAIDSDKKTLSSAGTDAPTATSSSSTSSSTRADNKSSHTIHGELWEVTSECLRNIDDFEGLSKGYYSRKLIPVQSEGLQRMAYIYILSSSSPTAEKLLLKPRLAEYSLDTHKKHYHAVQHIQIKQKAYYGAASIWGKLKSRSAFEEVKFADS